jgi:hypothetical protein
VSLLTTPVGVGLICAIATGSGTVSAANGDTIAFNTVGLLCDEIPNSPSNIHYNGTYRITVGSGHFAGAVGGGSLTAILQVGAPVFIPVSFIKIDGTINF